jgi:hypothetical protein
MRVPRTPTEAGQVDLITADELIPQPRELVLQHGTPDTIAGWKALADGLLTDQPCVFHRNLEISSRYAWIYKFLPTCFKWAGMAAFASHHVRLDAQAWPRITRFDDRWPWTVTCIVPRFRRFDVHTRLVDASLRRVFDEARDYASNPCVLPRSSARASSVIVRER